MSNFNLTPGTVNIRFGVGSIKELPEILAGLDKKKPFIVTDSGVAASGILAIVKKSLENGGFHGESFEGVKPNPTVSLIDDGAGDGAAHFHAARKALGVVSFEALEPNEFDGLGRQGPTVCATTRRARDACGLRTREPVCPFPLRTASRTCLRPPTP